MAASNVTAITGSLNVDDESYAYRRFGSGAGLPLLFLQHFMGTLDNWDPAVTDPLASDHEVILFDNAGIGRSSGTVPQTVAGMANHVFTFLDALGIGNCDVLGFSLGGMVAQQMVLDRPSVFRRMILVGTAPRGGENIMHLENADLARYMTDPQLTGFQRLRKLFFAPTSTSQAAADAFIARLEERKTDLDPRPGSDVAAAQLAAFREWEQFTGERYADLASIAQPALVVNGIHDIMIPVANSYALSANLPNAVLITYPDSGHGSLFQFHKSFTRQTAEFLK
jgi:pimeloyl-ACP methyl ester carboxylesterase